MKPVLPARAGTIVGLALLASTARETAGQLPTGVVVDGLACASDSGQTYSLYLPRSYAADRIWPLLFVFDPRGRGHAAAEIFRDAAETYGWIVASSDNTRSDGPFEPNGKALRAMWHDLPRRLSVDPRRIYAAGFSGTVAVACWLGQTQGTLAGIIGTGGPGGAKLLETPEAPAFFGAAGLRDFNHLAMKRLDASLASRQAMRRLEFFRGGHEWLPPALAREALEWFEVVAVREGRRQRDDALVASVLDAERTRAEALAREDRLLDALRLYEAIDRTFDGVAEVGFARARVRALEADKRVAERRRDEKRWDQWEEQTTPDAGRRLVALVTGETMMAARQAAGDLGIPALKTRAARTGIEADAAGRVLGWLFAQASFYLWRDMMDQRSWSRAIFAQTIALEIDPDAPVAWYRLAAAQARARRPGKALDALARSVDLGFRAADQAEQDEHLASLRDDPAFKSLVARMRAGP